MIAGVLATLTWRRVYWLAGAAAVMALLGAWELRLAAEHHAGREAVRVEAMEQALEDIARGDAARRQAGEMDDAWTYDCVFGDGDCEPVVRLLNAPD